MRCVCLASGARLARVLLTILGAVCLAAACADLAVPTAPPAPTVVAAMEIREQNGLRADRAWVESVEGDPASVGRLGIKVTPAEAGEIDERVFREAIVDREALGLRADETWVRRVTTDPASVMRLGGVLVAPEEAAAIDLGLDASRDLPDVLEGSGAPTDMNRVTVEVATATRRAGVEDEIADHLDAHDWLVVRARVKPALAMAVGELDVTVIDRTGRPVTEGLCALTPDVPGALPAGAEIVNLDPSGRCQWRRSMSLPATGYRVEVWRAFQDGLVGVGHAIVPAGGRQGLTITAGEPQGSS